jgi:hypothetical protein
LAEGWSVGAAASRARAGAERGGANRLAERGHRRQPHPRPFGGLHTGPSPVDPARTGSKHHLITDAGGAPLAIALTVANGNDITQLLPLVDAVGPIAGRPRSPRRRARRLLADRGYDFDIYRRALRARGITP